MSLYGKLRTENRFLNDEKVFSDVLHRCPQCNSFQEVFYVPTFLNEIWSRTLFCEQCSAIISKPKRFRGAASSCSPVEILFTDGSHEVSFKDYPSLPFKTPLKLSHFCPNGTKTELIKYHEFTKAIYKDELVVEQWFECADCLEERMIKYIKSKL